MHRPSPVRCDKSRSRWHHGGHLLAAFALLGITPAGRAASSPPSPIVATTSTTFFGYDGLWSAVNIRVGSLEQWISVLPSTLSQETWVIGPAGCDDTFTCQAKRGGLFLANQSATFQPIGFYDLNFDANLGDTGIGYYGLDAIDLSDVVSSPDQIIAVVNSTGQWLGSLGLGVQQTRFNDTNILPFLSSLVENSSLIPSHSYGYTAGAAYRLKGVPASLTLGGMVANRFTPNNMTFTLSPDYAPVVAVNAISVSASPADGSTSLPSNWDSNPRTLLDRAQADLFTIDSSTPFLWLPEPVCDRFASALNLTYNDTLQLYLFPSDNSSSPDTLTAWNLTFTFTLGNLPGASDGVELTLPYDAFNLQLSYPFPNLDANFTSPPTNYFPLRRAANSSQYTIGRAFLQETYLTVDYERNNFSLSQAVFDLATVGNVDLMAITRPANSTWAGPTGATTGGLSTGAKAGIGVAVAVAVLAAIGLVLVCCLRRKKGVAGEKAPEPPKKAGFLGRLRRTAGSKFSISELLGDKHHPTEVPADSSVSRFELSGSPPSEMAAEPVSPRFFADSAGTGPRGPTLARNDPRRPAELEHRDALTKEAEARVMAGSERSASPVPPYSPANNRDSSSVSPYSPADSRGFGTASSGAPGISPVGVSPGGHSRQSSNSRDMPSPVSPENTARPPQQFSNPSTLSPTLSSHGTLGVPQLNGRPPSRSPSTGSRFVEEGLTTVVEERSASPPSRPDLAHRRFSWDD